MTLDQMLAAARTGEAEVAEGWGQGRATFGGLVGGLLLARASAVCDDPARLLRAATVSFVAPIGPGPITIEGELLRAGSAVSQVRATIIQDGRPAAAMLASYGAERESALAVDPAARAPRPQFADPETIDPIVHHPGFTPEFFERVEMRIASGSPPFSGAREPDFGGWMRFAPGERPAAGGFTLEHLVILTDCWPPAVLPLLSEPKAASTLTWTFEIVGDLDRGIAPDAHWQYDVRTDGFAHGYGHAGARVWNPSGDLSIVSRQTLTVFG